MAAVGFLADVLVGVAALLGGSDVGGRGFDGGEVEGCSGIVSGGVVMGLKRESGVTKERRSRHCR